MSSNNVTQRRCHLENEMSLSSLSSLAYLNIWRKISIKFRFWNYLIDRNRKEILELLHMFEKLLDCLDLLESQFSKYPINESIIQNHYSLLRFISRKNYLEWNCHFQYNTREFDMRVNRNGIWRKSLSIV